MVRMRSPVRSRQLASFISSFFRNCFFLTKYCPYSKIKSAMSRYVARATIAQRRSLTQERTLRNCVNRFLTWRCLSGFLVFQRAFFIFLNTTKPYLLAILSAQTAIISNLNHTLIDLLSKKS